MKSAPKLALEPLLREDGLVPHPSIKPRNERSWNTFDRWLRIHPIIKRLLRGISTTALYGVVRNVDRSKPRQHMQLTRGGKTGGGEDYFDSWEDCSCLEPQGFSAGVPLGARGLIFKPGGTPEYTAAVGVCRYMDRPTFLDEAEVCVWTPYSSRMLCADDGSIVIGTDLADYKADPADLDEGAKLRLKAAGVKGDAEVYGESQVRQRAQPAGGSGASSTSQLDATGKATFKVDDGAGTTATITMQAGKITIATDADLEANVGGDMIANVLGQIVYTAGGKVQLNPGAGESVMAGTGAGGPVALEQLVKGIIEAFIGTYNGHTHNVVGTATGVPLTLATPPVDGDMASTNLVAD